MVETMEKPVFEVNLGVNTMSVHDADGSKLIFKAQRVGPVVYSELREAEYGPVGMGFVEPTFGELIPLVYSALGTKDTDEAKEVIQTLRYYCVGGKTVALIGREGILVEEIDNPSFEAVRGGLLDKYEAALISRLGSREENGVVYSDDGDVRFVPHKFKLKTQSALDFSRDSGLIALVGNKERADMMAQDSQHYSLMFWLGKGFTRTDSLRLWVPDVGGGFNIDRSEDYFDGQYNWCSFGLQKLLREPAIKNKKELMEN